MSERLRRRTVLGASLGTALSVLAGCQGPSSLSADDGTETDAQTTPWGRIHPLELLPRGNEGWERRHYKRQPFDLIGGEEGVEAEYRSSDGVDAEVVIIRPFDPGSEAAMARRFACAGWQVAVPYRAFAFAATTRVEREASTTERTTSRGTRARLTQVRATVPGSRADLVSLLGTCPGLTEEQVEQLAIGCDEE